MANKTRRFRQVRNERFTCAHCGMDVLPTTNGSCRNHCPRCLWSMHLDDVPGDRSANCGGLMRPIAVQQDNRRGWMIVHRCTRCGVVRRNGACLNDPGQPDNFAALLAVTLGAARGFQGNSGPSEV